MQSNKNKQDKNYLFNIIYHGSVSINRKNVIEKA